MQIRPATLDDVDAVADLLEVRSRAAMGVSEVTRDDLAKWWTADSSADRFVAENGDLVGYAAMNSSQAFEIQAADAEVNDAMLDVLLGRARERGFDTLHAMVVPQDEPFDALVRRAGFERHGEVLRTWRVLDAELPEARWPEGVTVRTYRAADAPAVKALLDEAYTGWDDTYAPREQSDWERFMTAHDEFDPELWFLAERDGEPVACALHWKEHQGRGWLKDLVVRERERGHGLGKALIHHGLRAYAARGVERVGLKVDSTNPTGAPQLYERVGFVTERRWGIWVKRL